MSDPRPPTPPQAPPPPSPEARPPSPTIAARVRAAPFTFGLLAVSLAWFVWAEKHGSTNDTSILLRFGAVEPVHVWSGEFWRLASYMFLHIGWVHLIWNGAVGAGICASVEKALGPARFLAAYLLSGFAGGCASTVLLYAPSAGASGAMFGMIGALLALRRRQLDSFRGFLSDPPTRSTLLNVAVWMVIGVTVMPFNNRAHFGGLVGGAAVTWVLTSSPKERRVFAPLLGIVFMALVLVACRPWWRPSGAELERLRAFGAAYLYGIDGFPKNRARGERMATRACEAGSSSACSDLGGFLRFEGEPSSQRRALELLDRACNEASDEACGVLGDAYRTGRDVPRDDVRAAELYERGCRNDEANACVGRATMLAAGLGGARDERGAMEIFHAWCAKGYADACGGEGYALVIGLEGAPQDELRGRQMLREACAKGSESSCRLEQSLTSSPPSADGGEPD
jgi:membrane associated rhomboid family serine protease